MLRRKEEDFAVEYLCCQNTTCIDDSLKNELAVFCDDWRSSTNTDKKFICSHTSALYDNKDVNQHSRNERGVVTFGTVAVLSWIANLLLSWRAQIAYENWRKPQPRNSSILDPTTFTPKLCNLGLYYKKHLVYRSNPKQHCIKKRVKRVDYITTNEYHSGCSDHEKCQRDADSVYSYACRHRPNARQRRQEREMLWMSHFPECSHAEIIDDIYNERNIIHQTPLLAPFTNVLFYNEISDDDELVVVPRYIRAHITFGDLPSGNARRPPIPANVYTQMARMGLREREDDAGHLLAYSLGGGMNNQWNYVPQSIRLNRDANPIGSDTRHVSSGWRGTETEILEFLRANRQRGTVDWSMIVIYGNSRDSGNFHRLRPIGFCLQWNTTDDSGMQEFRPVECFSNDPDVECNFDARTLEGLPFIEQNQWTLPADIDLK